MIEVQNLTKAFGDKTVLDNISVKFETGKTNLIIGQSGSGKTVLMKNLVGLLEPTSGKVLYDGRDFVQMSKKEKVMMRREMGMIFQSAALFDSLNVLENVMFPLDMFSNMNYRERVKRAQECLDRVNLIDAQQKYPGEISGGMQKRVAIARAIVMNPKYLFCDEPNSGLDPKTSLVIDELLSGITKDYNMTTIINTHDMNSVMGIGENICFICKGHKEWQGNKDQTENLWQHQIACRVDTHDVECIDLLGYSHGTQLGSDVGTHLSGEDETHDTGRELQQHDFSGGITRNPSRHPWTLDVQFHLDTDNCTDEE